MGSQIVKQVFKDYQPGSTTEPLPFNEESLQQDSLVDFLFTHLFRVIGVDSGAVDWDVTFPQSNIQKNSKSVDEQFMKKMLKHAVSEDSITGFATSEHTIKLLQESSKSANSRSNFSCSILDLLQDIHWSGNSRFHTSATKKVPCTLWPVPNQVWRQEHRTDFLLVRGKVPYWRNEAREPKN